MKTGKVAKIFGVDSKTIIAWVGQFPEYFSKEALGEGRTQRAFEPDDLIILNTIHGLRSQNVTYAEIGARLTSGERKDDLPPDATNIEGDKAVVVYSRLKMALAEVETLNSEVLRLRIESEEHVQEIRKLERTLGAAEERIKMLNELLEDNKKRLIETENRRMDMEVEARLLKTMGDGHQIPI
jgi:DNA-binding transcriptional MerR regulator